MEDLLPRHWAELNDLLFAGAWQEPLRRFRASFVYRGQCDADNPLTTSLSRLAGERAAEIEGPMLRAFRRYAMPYGLRSDASIWETLALAQHHGLPTRLLDWSYSPLVALHFATADTEWHDRDGAVWCADLHRTNERLPTALREILQTEETDVLSMEILERIASDLGGYDQRFDRPALAFFEPPSLDERVVNQFALFSLLSNPAGSPGDWLRKEAGDAVRRIRIPAAIKPEVRDKLDQANITERVLFPGLDGLSRWLCRYYTPS
ncbi:MAG: FRG domain-containing protein [Capsulimonadales bacterium]|nr:FRG domain-containing protein [Capsulimonadales bacterium]